jgi:uncharacterized protein
MYFLFDNPIVSKRLYPLLFFVGCIMILADGICRKAAYPYDPNRIKEFIMTHQESRDGHADHVGPALHAIHIGNADHTSRVRHRSRAVCQCLSASELEALFCSYATPILQTENFNKSKEYIQHGTITVYDHCVAVAYYSLRVANRLRIRASRSRIVRGALLHDYFLYDWHLPHEPSGLHGYTHPGTALANAMKEFDLDKVERDTIARHMFPLTPIPPRYIESLIVCLVDKVLSFGEVFGLSSYPSLVFIGRETALC